MTNLHDWLQELHSKDIRLSCQGDKLRINAPKGAVTPDIQNRLKEQKDALIRLLHQQQTITTAAQDNDHPLSFAQQRLWFVDQLEQNSPAYNMPAALRLRGLLNTVALEASLNEILHRHAVLRTCFHLKDGNPVQHICDDITLNPQKTDLSDLPPDARDTRIQAMIDAESQKPFDLQTGPLIRAQLLICNAEEHVLLLSMHHIVSDGWSIGLLGRELSVLYAAYTQEQPSPLPPLDIQYSDFAHWQNQWMDSPDFIRQRDYWYKRLVDAPHVLDLPCDYSRPTLQTYHGKTHTIRLDGACQAQLHKLARKIGGTVFMPLFGAFALLLKSYSAQNDLVIATPIANRNRSEVEDLIGFFANTLPLRIELEGCTTFSDILGRVQQETLRAYEHQDIPFEKIVDSLNITRDLSRSPLAQVVFVLQNAPRHASGSTTAELEGLQMEPIAFETGTVRLDLEVHVWEESDAMKVEFIYNTDLFAPETIARMADNFQAIIDNICTRPDSKLATLSCLSPAEEQCLLHDWNDTGQDYPRDLCLHQKIEHYAAQTPDAPALSCYDTTLSYNELNKRANQIAHWLIKQGIKTGDRVGVCLNRDIELIVNLLAILKTGAAYVPIDPAYPRARLKFLIEDSGAALLLSNSEIYKSHALADITLNAPCVLLDQKHNLISKENTKNTLIDVTSDALAYVIYTSGSTGRPKGVQIRHHSVINLLHGVHPRLNVSSNDVWTVFHSYAFDLSVWEIWSPFYSGGHLVVVPVELTQDACAFHDLLLRRQVSVLNQTPSFMRQLMDLPDFKTGAARSLRVVICGGEALPQDLADPLLELQLDLWNFYGPTEATVWSLIKKVDPTPPDKESDAVVSIGQPIANTTAYVLDQDLRPVPVGVIGELHLGGDGLAHGYFNREDLNQERFITSPFGEQQGKRLYKTGDLARRLPNGDFAYVARMDTQVKVRGYRIELGEIEQSLAELETIAQAVVIVREDSPADQRLCAYLVASSGMNLPELDQIRAHLKDRLPTYMVPQTFIELDILPLTPNGKIDHKNLPHPDGTIQLSPAGAQAHPRSDVEEQIAQIWREELNLNTVGVEDNFFDVGGYSFLMVKVCNRLRDSFDRDISVIDLFQHPTIAAIAGFLDQAQPEADVDFNTLAQRASKRKQVRARRNRSLRPEQKVSNT